MMSLSCRTALVGKRRILNLPLLPGDRVGSNGGGGGHRGKRRHGLGGGQPRARRPRLRRGRHSEFRFPILSSTRFDGPNPSFIPYFVHNLLPPRFVFKVYLLPLSARAGSSGRNNPYR